LGGIQISKPGKEILSVLIVCWSINIGQEPFSSRHFASEFHGDLVLILATDMTIKKASIPNSNNSSRVANGRNKGKLIKFPIVEISDVVLVKEFLFLFPEGR
jgi:hypothetical protein